MSFDYNSSGLRTKKTVNGEEKQYFYSGDLLVSEYDGVEYTNFTYGPNGEPVGFSFSDPETNESFAYYYYLKNIQGDILGLLDHQGAIYCTYSYDAWGKLLGAYDRNGNEITNPNHAAYRNPLRYRGYYYDTETGLYYLNSRYYNPEWGTFICADGYVSTGEQIVAKNMYAYCLNNPVNYSDPSGMACICRTKRVWRDHVCNNLTYSFGKRTPANSIIGKWYTYTTGAQLSYQVESNTTCSSVFSTTRTSVINDSVATGYGVRFNGTSKSFEVGIDVSDSAFGVYFSLKNRGFSSEILFGIDVQTFDCVISSSNDIPWDSERNVGDYNEITISGGVALTAGILVASVVAMPMLAPQVATGVKAALGMAMTYLGNEAQRAF